MKTGVLFTCVLVALSGIAIDRSAVADEEEPKARVTGIGGVFFLSQGKGKELSAWYEEHLGMQPEDFGAVVLQWEEDTAEDNGITVWGVADKGSEWFDPSESTFMINYRVDDMERMVEQLTSAGIEILHGPEYHENGVFAWIMDPDGNKIELWEPMNWDEKNKRE
jgi:predicted enzyme related to lactoylglutathione lyase